MVAPTCATISKHRMPRMRMDHRVGCLLAFAIPVITLLVVMAVCGLWPLGRRTMLLWDMEIQYINIYNWYADVLHGNASILYDFSKSLGGNMFGIFATYMASPINLLVFFFPKEHMYAFIAVATLLKIGLSGLFCQIYLSQRFASMSTHVSLLLSLSYALMEYNVGLCSNLHFLDAVYMLPVIALGIYRCVHMQKCVLLSLSIGFTVICNWYTGFMTCMGALVLIAVELLVLQGTARRHLTSLALSLACMLFGAFIGCITLVPTLFATLGGKGGVDLQYLLNPQFHCDIFEPVKGLFILSSANASYLEPAIFAGSFVLVLLLLLLCDTSIGIRLKLIALAPLIFLFFSFSFVPLEVIWTALKKAYSFHFRYSYVFSFFLVYSASLLLTQKQSETNNQEISYLSCCIACVITFIIYSYMLIRGLANPTQIGLSLASFASFIVLLLLYFKRISYKPVVTILLAGVLLCELGINAFQAFDKYRISADEYSEYVSEMATQVNLIKNEDPSFFRMEKTFSEMDKRRGSTRPVATEALTFNYNPITHYSSLIDARVNDFLVRAGYIKPNALASNYVNTNPLMDSILGIKYLMADKPVPLLKEISSFNLGRHGEKRVFLNEYSLGLATSVECDPKVKWSSNPFENQQRMLNTMTPDDAPVFKAQEIASRDGSSLNIIISQDGPLYIYFTAAHDEKALMINGEYSQQYFSRFYKNIVYAGYHKAGDLVNVSFKDDEGCTKAHGLLAYVVDEEHYRASLEKLQQRTYQPTRMTDVELSFDFSLDEDQHVFFAIPYDNGWSVTVDGERVEPSVAYDAFMALKLSEGDHHVQMAYLPPRLNMGLLFLFVGIAGTVLLETLIRRKKHRKRKEGEI